MAQPIQEAMSALDAERVANVILLDILNTARAVVVEGDEVTEQVSKALIEEPLLIAALGESREVEVLLKCAKLAKGSPPSELPDVGRKANKVFESFGFNRQTNSYETRRRLVATKALTELSALSKRESRAFLEADAAGGLLLDWDYARLVRPRDPLGPPAKTEELRVAHFIWAVRQEPVRLAAALIKGMANGGPVECYLTDERVRDRLGATKEEQLLLDVAALAVTGDENWATPAADLFRSRGFELVESRGPAGPGIEL